MPPKKAATKTGTKAKVTKVAAPVRNLRSRTVKSELPPQASPAKPVKSASPPKRTTKEVIRKATTKNTSKTIAKKPPTQNAGKRQAQGCPGKKVAEAAESPQFDSNSPRQEHSNVENTEQRFNQFWLKEEMQLQQMLEFVNGGAVTGRMETARELTKPFMSTADAPIPPMYDPPSPIFDPGSPESPQQPSNLPKKCTCGLKCCKDGIVCRGAGCYPPEVSDEEWLQIIEPPLDAEYVSCEMCRTILEVGFPTVVCLPRRLTVGCTCWSPLEMVLKMRGNGKPGKQKTSFPSLVLLILRWLTLLDTALDMAEPAKKKAVARAKTAITSLYEQQTARYIAKARRENWYSDTNSFITSIFNQVPGMQPIFSPPDGTIRCPASNSRPTNPPLKSPLRNPI